MDGCRPPAIKFSVFFPLPGTAEDGPCFIIPQTIHGAYRHQQINLATMELFVNFNELMETASDQTINFSFLWIKTN